MGKRIALVCLLTVLLWGENPQQNVNEKLILAYSTEKKVAEENLLTLKVYFRENQHIQTLQEKNNLHLAIQTLGEYHMTVIYPVKSLAVRNELLLTLSPIFKDMFSIHFVEMQATIQKTVVPKKMKTKVVQSPKKIAQTNKEHTLGLQWIVLLLLCAVGLFLSIRNRRKMLNIKQGQEDMQENQEKIEIEISTLGTQNA